MDEEPTQSDYKGCALTILFLQFAPWVCAFLILLFIARIVAAEQEHWLCQYTNALTNYPRVSLAEWDPERYTWVDMPSDLGQDGFLFLPLSEEFRQGYHIEFSPSEQELWLWPFWSLEIRRDQNGDHEGSHDFCPVLIIDLSEV